MIIDLQGQKRAHLLSWEESFDGPPKSVQWKVICKGISHVKPASFTLMVYVTVAQEVKGTATGPQKGVAKEAAAKQALEALGAPIN